jgi:2-keto-4-pentenoate hydratase/2-oxohepta-3-ene-1,7-dioic acid hydratase in catechol pathway
VKLATFTAADLIGPRVGLVEDGHVHPFPDDLTMRDVIDAGLDAARHLAERARRSEVPRPLEQVRLLAPLRPASVRDFVAFEEHVDGVRRSVDGSAGVPDAWYDAPTFYFTNPHTIVATGDDVAFPASCGARDFELEVAVVVGVPGESLTVAQAADHVFGYTVMNDWSARDLQAREMQVRLGPAKGKDFATTLGPWIVTADELDLRRDADGFLDLWCTVEVNGVEVGRDLLANAGWTFEAMIAHASRDSRVEPGDVLGSGTVGNGGCLAELWGHNGALDPPPLQPGDVVTLTVEGIGSVTNRVVVADPAPAGAPVRRRDHAAARQVLR